MSRLSTRLAESGRALAVTAQSPELRRAQLSFGAAWAAEWAFTVAIGVIAFRDGGATAVGLVALLRMAPSAVLGPVAAAFADRLPRDRVLIATGLIRAAAFAAAALVLVTDGPPAAVYALAVVQTLAATVIRPAHSALLPALCLTPHALTSAAVVRGLIDSITVLVGPLIAALLLGVSGPAAVLFACAVLSVVSALPMVGLRYEAMPRAAGPRRHLAREASDGIRAIAGRRDLTLLVGLDLAQTFTRGCFTVLVVVVAIDLLETGEAGVGVLTAAVGAGAIIGSIGATLLVGGRGLAAAFGCGVALWGLPIAVSGLLSEELLVMLVLAFIGVGNALVDVGLYTLPARLVPDEVLARVYGTLESLVALAVGVGSLVTPLIIELAGLRGAMVALGLVGPLLVALGWRRLRRLDGTVAEHDEQVAALRRVELLQPLPLPALEHLAHNLGHVEVDVGATVCSQGEPGDRFYIVLDGEADVERDGRWLRTIGPGEWFGEIALLRDTPRTATVTPRSPLALWVLERRHFVPIVTGYRASSEQADARVTSLMPGLERHAAGGAR